MSVDQKMTRIAMRCLVALDEGDDVSAHQYRGYLVGEGFFESESAVDRYIDQVVSDFRSRVEN